MAYTRYSIYAVTRKKGKERRGKVKKSQNRYILRIRAEAPSERIVTKFCKVAVIGDVIIRANSVIRKLRGLDIRARVQNLACPIETCATAQARSLRLKQN